MSILETAIKFLLGKRSPKTRARRAQRGRPLQRRIGSGVEWYEPRLLLTTILSETFEDSFPSTNSWRVGDSNSAGTTAYWDDVNSSFGGEGTHGGSRKGYVAGSGYSGTSSAPRYQDNMLAYMRRSVDLRGMASATLTFWYKSPSIESNYDFFRARIGDSVLFSTDRAQSAWTLVTIDLRSYLGASQTLQFEFSSDSSVTREGVYIDDILVTGQPVVASDSDDQLSESRSLGALTTTRTASDSINPGTDVDMFQFTVTAGQRISFDIDQLSSPALDSWIRVFNTSGQQLDFDDDGDDRDAPGESSSVESYFEYTFATAGTYYVGVSGFRNASYDPVNGSGDMAGSVGGYRLSLRGVVDVRSLAGADYYPGHLGSDYSTDPGRPEQDVGRPLVAPVTGRIVHFSSYGGYGDLLVGIEVPVAAGTMLMREDGIARPVNSGYVTVFLGHLTTRRYTSSNQVDDTFPQISLRVGDQIVAGVTHIGYIATRERNGGFDPHVHGGVLPYSENALGTAPFRTLPGRRTHYPGFWDTSDTRPNEGYNHVRSVLIAPDTFY